MHGGQNPVSGATIQLYTVGTTADGSNSTPILKKTVITLEDGSFDITNAYSCTGATEVYLTATGGDPDSGIANPNLALMVALGPCTAVPSMSYIEVNELTTVAAVNALAPYMKSYTAVGSGSSDVAAMQAAFALADEYVDPSMGTAPGVGVPTGYSVPVEELDTLGNIAAACVNSGGGTTGQQNACGRLFSLTTPSGMTPPSDTIASLLYLAKNPALNTQDLYQLQPKDASFQPILAAMPPNFAVALASSPLTLSPLALTYPTTPLGASAQAQSATLANTGTSAVTISGLGITGADAGDFAQTNNCPSMLAGGAACAIQTTFTPTAATPRSAQLVVNGGTAQLGLAGTGVASSTGPASLSPSSLSFLEFNVPQVVTLSNFGTQPLAIQSITASVGFAESDDCGNSLSGQSVCTIYVNSQPSFTNTSGTLTVIDSDTTDAQSVSLTATSFYSNGAYEIFDFGEAAVGGTGMQLEFGGGVFQGVLQGYSIYEYSTSLSGTAAADYNSDFYLGPSCSTKASTSCTIEYELMPTAVGVRDAIMTDNVGVSHLFKGIGASPTKSFALSPTVLSFPQTALGSSSMMSLTVSNTSLVNLSFNAPPGTFTGGSSNNGDFSVDAGCSTLSAAQSSGGYIPTCSLTVHFTPTATGARTATLTITEASGGSQSVLVTGNATNAAPVLTQLNSFGNVPIGSTGTAQVVTVTLSGQHAAGAQVTGPFVLTGANTCASGAATCQFSISFAPTGLGSGMGSLVVTDFATGTSATEPLSGTGVSAGATLSVNPSSLTFLPRSVGTMSIAQTVTLKNTGTVALVISSVGITGTNPGDYAETDNCSGASINPGETCTISVTNTPTFVGPSSAGVTIVSNAVTTPTVVMLSGTGQ